MMSLEGCRSHPLKGNARLQDPIVAPGENRERMPCPYAGNRRSTPGSELLGGPKQKIAPDDYVWGQ